DLEIFGDGFLDTLDADLPAVEVEDIAQGFLRQVERQLAVAEARESEHLLESALELAHVGADVLGDEKRDVFGQRDRVRLSLFQHDCDAHLQLRRLGGHGKAPSEARDQALFHRSEEHTSELQSLRHLVCRLLLEKKKYTPRALRATATGTPTPHLTLDFA